MNCFVIPITAISPSRIKVTMRKWRRAMDAKYFREKAELCLRLADGLSLNNPGRFQLMDLAEDFRERAKELEMEAAQQRSQVKN
jgi:hypothetical protein